MANSTSRVLTVIAGLVLLGLGYWWGASSQRHSPFQAEPEGTPDTSGIGLVSVAEGPGRPDSEEPALVDSTTHSSQEPRSPDITHSINTPGEVPEPESNRFDQAGSGSQNDKFESLPEIQKIPIIDEARSILSEGRPAKLHKEFEASKRDDSWSPYMESQLRTYIQQKPSLSTFSFPVIECRLAGCEIQAIGYVENANQIWVNATVDIYVQPWFSFSGMSTSVSSMEGANDIVALVVILIKEPA